MALATVAALAVGAPLGDSLSGGEEAFVDPGSESERGRERLDSAVAGRARPDVLVLYESPVAVRSIPGRARVRAVARRAAAEPGVKRVTTFESAGVERALSEDGRATYLHVVLEQMDDRAAEDVAGRLRARLAPLPGVDLGGRVATSLETREQIEADLDRARAVAVPLILAVSFLVFRGIVAALLPLAVGLVAVAISLAGLRAVNELVPLSVFALNLVSALCLALAIDYTILVVSRFREERAHSENDRSAIVATLATAGRSIAFSSAIVGLASASLLVFPQRFLYSMGVAGMLVAAGSLLAAVTVLPALLAMLGPRIDILSWRRRDRPATESGGADAAWGQLAKRVMRTPGRIALASAAVLLALGLPFLDVEFVHADARALPADRGAHRVEAAFETRFASSPSSAIELVSVGRPAREEMSRWFARIRSLPGVAAADPPVEVGRRTWRTTVLPRESATTTASQDLVRAIRDVPAPASVRTFATGRPAAYVDQERAIDRGTPLALGLLALGTLVTLLAMTRSVVLSLKTLVLNLCTISAAFGCLVLLYQKGKLLGIPEQGGLEITQPILIFVLAFALSTDYGVFLLSRIVEARRAGLDTRAAVADGLGRTGGVVSAAAILFAVTVGVFFVSSTITFVEEIGVGVGLAVLIDAFVVRALLFPALMALLGEWNWWSPRWLAGSGGRSSDARIESR